MKNAQDCLERLRFTQVFCVIKERPIAVAVAKIEEPHLLGTLKGDCSLESSLVSSHRTFMYIQFNPIFILQSHIASPIFLINSRESMKSAIGFGMLLVFKMANG
jgi:hypothetical protein